MLARLEAEVGDPVGWLEAKLAALSSRRASARKSTSKRQQAIAELVMSVSSPALRQEKDVVRVIQQRLARRLITPPDARSIRRVLRSTETFPKAGNAAISSRSST